MAEIMVRPGGTEPANRGGTAREDGNSLGNGDDDIEQRGKTV